MVITSAQTKYTNQNRNKGITVISHVSLPFNNGKNKPLSKKKAMV